MKIIKEKKGDEVFFQLKLDEEKNMEVLEYFFSSSNSDGILTYHDYERTLLEIKQLPELKVNPILISNKQLYDNTVAYYEKVLGKYFLDNGKVEKGMVQEYKSLIEFENKIIDQFLKGVKKKENGEYLIEEEDFPFEFYRGIGGVGIVNTPSINQRFGSCPSVELYSEESIYIFIKNRKTAIIIPEEEQIIIDTNRFLTILMFWGDFLKKEGY